MKPLSTTLIALTLFATAGAGAQGLPVLEPDGVETATQATAPVEIDGSPLFTVGAAGAEQARQRAREIASQIREIASDPAVAAESIRVFDLRNQTNILAGRRLVMSVFDIDGRRQGQTRLALAGVYKERIIQAIRSYRAERTGDALLDKGWRAGAATAGLVVALLLLTWLFRRLNAVLAARYKSRMKDIEIQSFHIVEAEDLWSALRGAVGTIHGLTVIALLIGYFYYVLGLFPWTRPFGLRSHRLVLEPLDRIGGATLDALPNLAFIVILALIIRYLLKMTRLFFGAVALGRISLAGFEREWAMPTYKIVRLFAIAFAVIIAYPYIPGSDTAAFKGVSIFVGLVLSLGSTSIIGNLIAGYTMTYRRAFRVGDRIKVRDTVGDVVEMRLLETHLRSLKNEEVVVPNTVILNNELINYSKLAETQGLILHTKVGIGYEVPWREVEHMLKTAAERTEGILRKPPPFVLAERLDNFCVLYELNAYIDNPAQMPDLYSRLHANILDVFNEERVQIMTPAYIADPEEPKIAPGARGAPVQPKPLTGEN